MFCIFCGSDTQVVNSRGKRKLPLVWRRRKCLECRRHFTTLESPDYRLSLSIRNDMGDLEPFERDNLYVSVYLACGHREDPCSDATALTSTVISKLLKQTRHKEPILDKNTLSKTVYEVLKRFDRAAATAYRAYHPPETRTA